MVMVLLLLLFILVVTLMCSKFRLLMTSADVCRIVVANEVNDDAIAVSADAAIVVVVSFLYILAMT